MADGGHATRPSALSASITKGEQLKHNIDTLVGNEAKLQERMKTLQTKIYKVSRELAPSERFLYILYIFRFNLN